MNASPRRLIHLSCSGEAVCGFVFFLVFFMFFSSLSVLSIVGVVFI